jgi:hypothetical protein
MFSQIAAAAQTDHAELAGSENERQGAVRRFLSLREPWAAGAAFAFAAHGPDPDLKGQRHESRPFPRRPRHPRR